MAIAGVKEHNLKCTPLEQIKKEAGQEELGI
jgi:hypothetical protein